jgi:hypothetical protein
MNANVNLVNHSFLFKSFRKKSFFRLIEKVKSGESSWPLTKALRHMAKMQGEDLFLQPWIRVC